MVNKGALQHILFALQDGRCFYCHAPFSGPERQGRKNLKPCQWTRDHLLPRANGAGSPRNVVFACLSCNRTKGLKPATADQIARAADIHDQAVAILFQWAPSENHWNAPREEALAS